MVFSYFLQISADIASYIYVGKLPDPINTASLTLGISSVNMFSLAILYGLNMGIDTLVTYHFGKK